VNSDHVYAHRLRPGDTVRVPGRGVVVIADIRLHETPVHPLETLGSETWTIPGVTLDDLQDVNAGTVEITESMTGQQSTSHLQSPAYDITFRDGGSGTYAWNTEIRRTGVSASP
jgi:hypothetical protein